MPTFQRSILTTLFLKRLYSKPFTLRSLDQVSNVRFMQFRAIASRWPDDDFWHISPIIPIIHIPPYGGRTQWLIPDDSLEVIEQLAPPSARRRQSVNCMALLYAMALAQISRLAPLTRSHSFRSRQSGRILSTSFQKASVWFR